MKRGKGPSPASEAGLSLASRLFKSVREMSQKVRISLFGGNCHVSLLCLIPLVRCDEGLKTQPPVLNRPQPLTGTHGLVVLGFCFFQKQTEENYCSISLSLVHHCPVRVGCK